MKKRIIYILSAIFLSLGLSAFAQTIFNIDDEFFIQTGLLTWNYSPLHFNFSGNDFDGIMFWWTGLNQTWQLQMWWVTINCNKQINGLYLNTARGNRMRPLDQNTLAILSWSSSFVGYGDISFTGGFFTECTGGWIDTGSIYGYIKHTYEWVDYEMWAWINYNFPSWNPIATWSGSLKRITVPNNTAAGYIFDNHGWTAKVYSNMELYGDAIFTWNEVVYVDPFYVSTWNRVKISVFSNKSAQFEITWDVVWTFVWTLNAWVYNDIDVQLVNLLNQKDLVVTISTGSESVAKNLSLIIQDTTPPSVSLLSPANWTIINWNTVVLAWTGSDNMWISHYSLYASGAGAQYGWSIINNTLNSLSLWPIINGTYTWYIIATDYGNNTWQTATWTFTISGNILWPTLISPISWANINIWELNLLWNQLYSVNSGYTRQISSNNTFSNIVASGSTNSTWVTIVHHPDFMTWTFYWRVIDKKTAWVSEHRTLNIIDLMSGVDTKVEQFNFNTITGAALSQVYSSNTWIITWLTNNVSVLARLENNVWALFVNNIMVWTQYLVKNNDQIRIELISSNNYNTWVSAKLIVGTGNSLMSGKFEVYTSTWVWINTWTWNIPYALRIQAILFVDSIAEMYKHNPQKFAQFLTTFKAILKDRSDLLANSILQTTNPQEKAFLIMQKDSIDYLMFVVNEYINNIDYSQSTTYIAPNGKKYLVRFDDNRFAYTSPNFIYPKYFPTRELFKRHIDINNPWNYYDGISGDTITAPNGKKYTIHTENGKWTSHNMLHKKYFDTRDQIIEHIVINNPSSTWDHNIDTSFTPIVFVAPNEKSYTIFKTASTGNNPNKYSSFMFVTPKYFSSLESAKNHINSNNK